MRRFNRNVPNNQPPAGGSYTPPPIDVGEGSAFNIANRTKTSVEEIKERHEERHETPVNTKPQVAFNIKNEIINPKDVSHVEPAPCTPSGVPIPQRIPKARPQEQAQPQVQAQAQTRRTDMSSSSVKKEPSQAQKNASAFGVNPYTMSAEAFMQKQITTDFYDEQEALEKKEYDESLEKASQQRMSIYLALFGLFYLIFLGIGYYHTSFDDEVPQVVSLEERKQMSYLSSVDDYLSEVQKVNSEILSYSDMYNNKIIGDADFVKIINGSQEKLNNIIEELDKLDSSQSYSMFHAQLVDMIKSRVTANKMLLDYLVKKEPVKLTAVVKSTEDYNKKLNDVLLTYNRLSKIN